MTMNLHTILKSVEKPGRYTGGEWGQTIKDKNAVDVRFAFCFPDNYEIGMSNLGIRILYGVLNNEENVWCERAYAPWPDMEEKMREYGIPLYAHESGDPLSEFDIVGFALQYELCYTNVLNMLELGGIPLLASERGENDPIIIGGGPCAYNAEPIADFFDVLDIGEGEEMLPRFTRMYAKMKREGASRAEILRATSHLDGFYVPALYEVEYGADGTISSFEPKYDDIPRTVQKQIIADLDSVYFPDKFVMPYIETVHDRIVPEVYRGCIRGCRFCQAGMIYRPVREKSPDVLDAQCRRLYENTGFDEISLCSLSISDYSRLGELTDKLLSWTDDKKVSLSLPSLRVDSFTKELMEKISTVRTSGITFAPEAGTQRMRDVINKNVHEEELLRACANAFECGKNQVKLYFMDGLPTETREDVEGIAKLAKTVVDSYYSNPNVKRGKSPQVTISVACFIPKPFTPFQWATMLDPSDYLARAKIVNDHVKEQLNHKSIRYNWHEADVTVLEGILARGDRKISKAILYVYEHGEFFDAWSEFFHYDLWLEAFAACGIDIDFYTKRARSDDEIFPWDFIDVGVTKAFMLREWKTALSETVTPNCRMRCSGCGARQFGGGVCFENQNSVC